MTKFRFLLPFLCVFYEVNGAGHVDVDAHHFCYEKPECGPLKWGPAICQNGSKQSPIDIDLPKTVQFKLADFQMNDAYLNQRKSPFFMHNNGHTVQFALSQKSGALTSDLRLCGGGLPSCYRFAQFHFHWDKISNDGAEHTIGRRKFPLEIHLVHYKETYDSLTSAVRSNNDDSALAVVGVLFEITRYDNPDMDTIVKSLGKLQAPGTKVINNSKLPPLAKLFPQRKEFARYYGSLTTPTCDEKVIWTVFLSTITISDTQMNEFRKLRDSFNVSSFNFRPVQALKGRTVDFYRSGNFTLIK